MTSFQMNLLLLSLLGYNVSGSYVRRRAVGLKFFDAKKKIDIAGPSRACLQQDVDEILASCDCKVNMDGVEWKDESEYIGCLIVHKTFTPCPLNRVMQASPCLPFPTAEPTTSNMPSTSTPTAYPSISPTLSPSASSFPSNSMLPSSVPSLSNVPSVIPTTPKPSFVPSLSTVPSLEPSPIPSISPSLFPSEESAIPSISPSLLPSEESSAYRDGTGAHVQGSDVIFGLTGDNETRPFLEIAGNNRFPPEAFPLKICQGDCDSDKDCQGDLQCFPRSGFEPVPRCQGNGLRGKDYCTDPRPAPWSGNDPFYKFRLRLFFDPLYFWQETHSETWWCMECTKCDKYTLGDGHEANCTSPGPNTASCMEDHNIWIMRCKRSQSDFQFNILKNQGSGDQIRVDSTNLCFSTHKNIYLELKTCNNTDSKQLWMPIVNLSKFEMRPYWQSHRPLNDAMCLTQMHHPKSEELIGLQPCGRALRHETLYWEEFHAV